MPSRRPKSISPEPMLDESIRGPFMTVPNARSLAGSIRSQNRRQIARYLLPKDGPELRILTPGSHAAAETASGGRYRFNKHYLDSNRPDLVLLTVATDRYVPRPP